MSEISEQC